MKKKMSVLLSLVLVFVMVVAPLQFTGVKSAAAPPKMYVYYFAVGSGDCMLVQVDGKSILIDSGTNGRVDVDAQERTEVIRADQKSFEQDIFACHTVKKKVKTNVKAFLDQKLTKKDGKYYLDYVIITHYDGDHIGGLTDLLQGVKVGTFLSRKYSQGTLERMKKIYDASGKVSTQYGNYIKLMNAVAVNAGITTSPKLTADLSGAAVAKIYNEQITGKVKWAHQGQDSSVSMYASGTNKLTAKFYNKSTTYINQECVDQAVKNSDRRYYGSAINNDSLIFKLTYTTSLGTKKFMFLGDIGKAANEHLVKNYSASELKSDALKVAHHGYKGNENLSLLSAIKPTVSVISTDGHTKAPKAGEKVITKMKQFCLLDEKLYNGTNRTTKYLSPTTIKSRYGTVYETWAMEAYADTYFEAGDRNYAAIMLTTDGASFGKYAAGLLSNKGLTNPTLAWYIDSRYCTVE